MATKLPRVWPLRPLPLHPLWRRTNDISQARCFSYVLINSTRASNMRKDSNSTKHKLKDTEICQKQFSQYFYSGLMNSLCKLYSTSASSEYDVSAEFVNEQLQDGNIYLVDVREPHEHAIDGYIEGAVNIPCKYGT